MTPVHASFARCWQMQLLCVHPLCAASSLIFKFDILWSMAHRRQPAILIILAEHFSREWKMCTIGISYFIVGVQCLLCWGRWISKLKLGPNDITQIVGAFRSQARADSIKTRPSLITTSIPSRTTNFFVSLSSRLFY